MAGRKARMTSSQHGSYTLGHKHTTMAKNNELQASNSKLISEISPQFRLGSATRPHEVGIASNRGSACRGEYVLGSCTHRPSRQQSWGHPNPAIRRGKVKPAMKLKSYAHTAQVATYPSNRVAKSNYIGELLLDFRINFGLLWN